MPAAGRRRRPGGGGGDGRRCRRGGCSAGGGSGAGGGIAYAVAAAAKAGAAGALVRAEQPALPQSHNEAAAARAAAAAAQGQKKLAAVFCKPWAEPLHPFPETRHSSGNLRIRNALCFTGNHAATAGVRITSPVVLAFGLAKVVWDTWPKVLVPLGAILGIATGAILSVGIGGCGLAWNVCGVVTGLLSAAWHTAQQGIRALLIGERAAAAETAVTAGVAVAPVPAGKAESSSSEADAEEGKIGSDSKL